MRFIQQLFWSLALASLPRYWRRLVYLVLVLIPVVFFSFMADVFATPADPTLEQYRAHSSRTSVLLLVSAVLIGLSLVYCIVRSIHDHRNGGVTFEEAGAISQVTGHVRPTVVQQPLQYDDFIETTASDDDPDAEYKILREAAARLEALRRS